MGFYLVEQILNGLQLGFLLFLVASGLTLVLGVANVINLAHGAFYMVGAYLAAALVGLTGSFGLAILLAALATSFLGLLAEAFLLRHLYNRDHLDQVLATFALMLVLSELVRMTWGSQPVALSVPAALAQPLRLGEFSYSTYRLALIAFGAGVSLGLFWLIFRTRLGMWLRAAAANWEMARCMGVPSGALYKLTFALGAFLAGLAGSLVGPITAVHLGMGTDVLILCFVIIVIGGVGSIKGAFVAALLVGLVDNLGRAFLPSLFQLVLSGPVAASLASALVSTLVYLFMALVLVFRPEGLFPVRMR